LALFYNRIIKKHARKRRKIMADIREISELLQKGRSKNVKALVEEAIAEGQDPKVILNEGLLSGMMIIGEKFKNNEVFVPEVLVAARAMNAGLTVLEPKLVEVGNKPVGKVVIGTIAGDLHDIGKNLVAMMLKGAGFEVVDLGVDVAPATFVDKAEEVGADVICVSALLTTTMPGMQTVVETLKERGLRDKYIVMIGGAPVNQAFADQVGADYYTAEAASCAEVAKKAVESK
jgi:5-methyltetrahydrofolate--homocysteine methyltransferase